MFYTSLLIIALAVTTSKVQATPVPFNGKVGCTSHHIVGYLRPYYENRLLLMLTATVQPLQEALRAGLSSAFVASPERKPGGSFLIPAWNPRSTARRRTLPTAAARSTHPECPAVRGQPCTAPHPVQLGDVTRCCLNSNQSERRVSKSSDGRYRSAT
jgi:hypothetical protein